VGDIFPAALAAFGIMAALRHAERTGEGQFVDVAMYDSIVSLCERIVFRYGFGGVVSQPEGNGHPMWSPFGLFPADDGWVAIACPTDRFWAELCRIMGRPALAEDERFATLHARTVNRAAIEELVGDWTRSRSRATLMAELGGRVPFGPVNNAADICEDPHLQARDMLVKFGFPGIDDVGIVAGNPVRMTRTSPPPPGPGPLLGEHSTAVLRQVGYTDDQISALRSAGVIGCPPLEAAQ
jgi:crotonobetainyl-CoA:carnitine CoA-transferase CaiB-like acyl-CoA transferase